MNSNNPLISRLYQTKSSKKKRPASIKDDLSSRDKILVPKLASKNLIQPGINIGIQKQKNMIINPNLTKLPPLSQKQLGKQKQRVITSQKKPAFRERKISFNTTHDLAMFPTQLSFGTPKLEETQQQIVLYTQKKQQPKRPKTVKSQPENQRNEEQLFDYLKILEKNQQLKEQFCYMNRGDLPYSYFIVNYQAINKNQFLTVSLRGVSIYKDGQSEFTTAQKLSRQIQLFRKIKKIDFFRLYVIQKAFKHWRYRSVRRKFQNQCRFLGKNLISQNLIIQKYLHFLYNLQQQFSKSKFLDIRISSTGSLQSLQAELKRKQIDIIKDIDYLQSSIEKQLKQSIQKNMNKFRKQERVNLTSDGKQLGQQTFLPYDTKKKTMKYTQIAKLKQFQQVMYRLLKLTDFVRFTIKCNIVKQGLINYIAQLNTLKERYIKRKQVSFVSWIVMKTKIQKPNKNANSILICNPSLQDIQKALAQHLESILRAIQKKHYLLIDKKNQYYCQSYDPTNQQVPSKLDFKYYIQTNKQFVALRQQCFQKLGDCVKDTQQRLQKAEQSLLKIYDESFITRDVNSYMENQSLKHYLSTQAKSREIINSWQQIVEYGVVYLDMSDTIFTIKQKFQEKFKNISNAIPVQVVKRCEELAEKIKFIYNIFKENPSTVMEYINFIKDFNKFKKEVDVLDKKIQGILQLQEMVYKNGLRIGQASKLHISQCSTYFRQLSKRLQEIQGNQQRQKKKFYKIIDDMVDPLDTRAQQLYKKIYEDQLISKSQSQTSKCLQRLASLQNQFQKIKQKKQQLFYYQNQLKLGHKDLPNYFKLESTLQWVVRIWKGRKKYEQFLHHVNTKGYAQKTNLNISDLKQFLRDIQLATSQIQMIQLLQNFKQDAIKVLNILQVCRMLSADSLQDEHKNQIKQKLETKSKKIKDYIFLIEGGRNIICKQLVQETNIFQIRNQLQQIVHASAQQSIIKKSIQEVEQFWKKNKIIIINQDLAKNGSEIPHFGRDQNQRLLERIGSYLMSFKSILGSKHSVGQLNSRVVQQIQICQYLKKLIEKWIQVQRQWMKLLPLMTNCPSVKHQSNVYFQFTSLDNSLRKHNRQVNDYQSLRRIVQDYTQKRYLALMGNIQYSLQEVNKTFSTFLQIKRNTYHRFFFLADQQLIQILQNTKNARSLAQYARYCFNCDRLLLDKQLVSGFETLTQAFKLRKVILKGQPDQMFKSVEQNMKVSLKFSIITLLPKMKVGMNIQQQHQNCLQAVLVADKFLWTQMTELYLNPTSYQSYQLFLRRPCQQLTQFIKKSDISADYRYKISVRLVQAMGLRQIGQQLMKLQITKQDFKWKQQKKYTFQDEEIVITHLNRKFIYGLQYYPPSKITIPTGNYQMLLSQTYETSIMGKVLIVTGVEGDGKRNLMLSCAQQYGCLYRELVCNKNISIQYIMRFVQGAVLAGAWLSFYQFEHLQAKVLVKLLNQIRKVVTKIKKIQEGDIQNSLNMSGNIQNIPNQPSTPKQLHAAITSPLPPSQRTIYRTNNRVMFNFITHGFFPQRVSVYQFDTFALSQPNHKKVCQWLLQVNNFWDCQQLSKRLVIFLETIFPFLQRVMGSFMRILRKVIDTACKKKQGQTLSAFKQIQIIAETFKQQILDKSDQNIHQILYEALHTYFNYQAPQQYRIVHSDKKSKSRSPRKQSFSADSKIVVLSSLIKKNVQNILVIGPRTNKSSLIRQAGRTLNRQIVTIYPQSSDYFFNDDTIQKLNKLDNKQIIHYDGQYIIRQWNDLVISGYLLMEGKKIRLNNQLIIQLRAVNNCSPSFIGSCQIVYIGNFITKKQKFNYLIQQNCQLILQPMTQIFGQQLQNLSQHLVQVYGYFLRPYAKDPRAKNYHKLITWLGTLLGIEGLWNRFYAGRYNDFTVSKYSQELVTIDQSKYFPVEQQIYQDNFIKSSLTVGKLLIQTKSTIMYCQLMKNLMHIQIPIIITGKFDSGKSTLIKLLLLNMKNNSTITQKKSLNSSQQNDQGNDQQSASIGNENFEMTKISLPIRLKTNQWTKLLRSTLTNIRREGNNYLVNDGDNDIIVAVDDLDLGFQSHREYLRQLIDLKTLRDPRFQEYTIQKIKIIGAWHKENLKQNLKSISKVNEKDEPYKIFDRMVQLQIPQFSKQSLSTIIRTNIEHFTKKNNMSKEVVNIIDTHLIKCMLIAFDDITNVSGQNCSASIILAVLRNMLSLPKKNVLMSSENYVNYFRTQLKSRMMEKSFTKKSIWQYNNILQNLNKVVFNSFVPKVQPVIQTSEQQSQTPVVTDQSILLYQQNQIKPQLLSKLKQKILSSFPNLYLFNQMLKVIGILNNQLHMIDYNSIIVGRTGTGKSTILKVVASLNKMDIYRNKQSLAELIVRCLRGETIILMESYLRRDFTNFIYNNQGTQFQKISGCLNDEDLQKLVTGQNLIKQYNSLANQIPNRDGFDNSKKVLNRVLSKIKSVIVFDTLMKYKEAVIKYRQLNRYFVCYINQWPSEALLNISGINIQRTPKIQTKQEQERAEKQNFQINLSDQDFSKLFAEIFTTTNKIMQDFQQNSISIKKFRCYLRVFQVLYQIRNKKLSQRVQFYTKIYSKFHDACVLIQEWEKRVDILRLQLEQSLLKLDEQLKKNKLEAISFANLYQERGKQQQILLQKNSEMASLKRQMQKKLKGMKEMMQQISKIVGSMQRSQMSELKKIYKSSKIVSFGLECLCILLGQQPNQKSINKILADPNLMMKMKSQNVLQNKSLKVLEKFKNQFEGIKLEYQNKSKQQASRVIIDWIKSVLQYWNVLDQHHELNSKYKLHKQQYEKSSEKQRQIQVEIDKLKHQMIALNRNYTQLFKKRQQDLKQYNTINSKVHNAKSLLPALKKSQEQTWKMIKELRNNLSCLIGNLALSAVCLVYLPLKKLKLKKTVIDQVIKILNSKMVQFSHDFMSLITETQDAVIQDLNLVAIKQLEEFPVLIVDPERRAIPFLFDQNPAIATSVISKNISDLTNSQDIVTQIQKNMKPQEQKQNQEKEVLVKKDSINIQMQQSMPLQQKVQIELQQQANLYIRKCPILHTTQQNYRFLLQKMPQNTFIIDWKFTTININEKVFLRIAAKKKPQYFEIKKQLNRKIKKDLKKIEQYKSEIYNTICQKNIQILDDDQFISMSINLQNLQVETEKNRQLEKQKIQQIKQYAKEINEQVVKVMYMINALKKIKNIALDIVLDIACQTNDILGNIIRWVLATLQPNKRLGWLLSIAIDFNGQMNQQLLNILIKDTPLKINQIARHKKPITISVKNYENLCKISGYTANLKIFSEAAIKHSKQFETWTLDNFAEQIPSLFRPQVLNMFQQLVAIKVFKSKSMLSVLKKHIKQILKLPNLQPLSNRQILQRTNKRFPIIAHCTLQSIQQLCEQLNNSKLCIKNIIQITDNLQLKRFIWAQMNQGNWVVLHSIYDRNAREVLEDIVEYVVNYEEQEQFRVFVYVDQVQLDGYQDSYEITTKYNNIASQVLKNKKKELTDQALLFNQSKYLQNISINMYQQLPSLKKNIKKIFSIQKIQLPQVSLQTVQLNPTAASFIAPQTPVQSGKNSAQKPNTPLSNNLSSVLGPANLVSMVMSFADKDKTYKEKITVFACWLKFPKLRLKRTLPKLIKTLSYIKQYNVPLEFNLHAVSSYLGRYYSYPLDTADRIDVQQLAQRIIDQSKINDKHLFNIPTHKQSIALAMAGIGRAGLEVGKDWIDQRIITNYQLLGCEESYMAHKNAIMAENMMNVLGEIRYYHKSVKQQVSQIRLALNRLPGNVLVFNRQVRNILFLHSYMNQLNTHNKNILAAKQFMQWVNISSNQDFQEDQVIAAKPSDEAAVGGASMDVFSWPNLIQKVRKLTGISTYPHKIRAVLSSWLQTLKRRHQFLLYWNLDNPILVLHPVLLTNFPMVISTYIINYLSTNYQKIKIEGESVNESILYTLQIQFSRQTDQKQLYMTEGILLPDLIYKQFRYNFEFKMLDGILQWNGEQPAPLIMLKMKKLPKALDGTGKEKDEEYQSPSIQIATRNNNFVEVVYKIETFIDGNFQEWGLRRPMLISQ